MPGVDVALVQQYCMMAAEEIDTMMMLMGPNRPAMMLGKSRPMTDPALRTANLKTSARRTITSFSDC